MRDDGVTIGFSDQVCGYLDQLVATELFGETRAEVAGNLLMSGLRQAAIDGFFKPNSTQKQEGRQHG